MKRKEWLAREGHIKTAGRGRISAVHQALCDASGIQFSDAPKMDKNGKRKSAAQVEDTMVEIGAEVGHWPRESTRVYRLDTGELTKATTVAACFHCNISLSHCLCFLLNRTPRAIVSNDSGYVDVRLEVT